MTHLEDLWDDLPVGPAPVDAIVRRATVDDDASGSADETSTRGTSTPTEPDPARRLRRSLAAVGVVGGIAAAFVIGTLVHAPGGGTGDGGGVPGPASDAVPAAFHGALTSPASCDDLLRYYQDKAAKLVGPRGWKRDYPVRFHGLGDLDDLTVRTPAQSAPLFTDATRARATVGTQRQVDSATGTNVQEAGVDEPDVVKTDGSLLVRLHDGVLSTYDVSGAVVKPLGDLDLGNLDDASGNGGLLLAGHTVVALASTTTHTRVETIDVSTPAVPTLVDTTDYDAGLAAARQSGTDVRLILQTPLPHLDFDDTTAANVKLVRATTLADWLPQLTTGGRTGQLLDCSQVAVPRADLALGTMSVVGFDAAAPHGATTPRAVGLAGVAPTTYESQDHLYLAASPSAPTPFEDSVDGLVRYAVYQPTSGAGTTNLYDFALNGPDASYAAAGEVDGIVSDRWSMDEKDGVLRVAVEPSHETGNFTSIVTFRRTGDQLLEVGRLDGLGRGEQMQSVRWFDNLALLVTYRQTDPLFAVDLTDQRHPRLIGRLKLSGFSSYLHPLGTDRVIGMGEGPVRHHREGARAALFDTSDPAHLRRLSVVDYQPGSQPRAADDPRQFTWLPAERTALTVVTRGNTGFLSTMHLADGTITEHRMAAEYGSDVADLRVVPVPALQGDGDRVLLVTGGTVSFLDLGLQ